MSSVIPLEVIPNQTLSTVLDSDRYDIALRDTGTSMVADFSINEEVIITGLRCVGGTPLIPYEYLRPQSGNFIFSTPDEQIPSWTNFSTTQFLFYFSALELEELSA